MACSIIQNKHNFNLITHHKYLTCSLTLLYVYVSESDIFWKGFVWRLQFQKQNKNIPIIYVNITTLKYIPKAS